MLAILKARIKDANKLLKVKINAFKEEVELYGSGPPGYDVIENVIQAIREENYFKITNEEEIIGGIFIGKKGEGHYHIGVIFVDLIY